MGVVYLIGQYCREPIQSFYRLFYRSEDDDIGSRSYDSGGLASLLRPCYAGIYSPTDNLADIHLMDRKSKNKGGDHHPKKSGKQRRKEIRDRRDKKKEEERKRNMPSWKILHQL